MSDQTSESTITSNSDAAPAAPVAVQNAEQPASATDTNAPQHSADGPAAPSAPSVEHHPQPAVTADSKSESSADEQPVKYEYPTIQNPDAQSIINVFAEKNIDPAVLDTVFAKALQTGNVEDIDKAALKRAMGASADLVLGMARKVADDNRRATEQAIQEVHSMCGGKAAWEAMARWANAKAGSSPEFEAKLATYRNMIDAGGEQRRLAVKALKDTYMNDPNVTVHPNLVTGDQQVSGTVGNPIKSSKEYSELLSVAYKNRDADAVADIQQRWRAGAGNPNNPKPIPGFPY